MTLKLASTATNPKGQAAPAGFFKLGATTVTVPAGGKASVDVTVNTKLGGTLDGAYSAYVTATGGGQTVRTAAAVQREIESYDVTVKHIGRDGKPTADYNTILYGYSGLGEGRGFQVTVAPPSGTTTMRVPKGTYLLDAWIAKDFVNFEGGVDWLVQPKLSVTKNVSVTIDARKTKTSDITVPDAQAKQQLGVISYNYDPAGIGFSIGLKSFEGVRVAPLGGDVSGLHQTWSGQWTKGDNTEYDVATTADVKKIQGDKVRHFKAGELATVKNNLGSGGSGKTGAMSVMGFFPTDFTLGMSFEQKLPSTRTLYLSTVDKVKWMFDLSQYKGKDADGFPITEAYYSLDDAQTFKAGQKYSKTFNTAVFGPHLNKYYGLFRYENAIYGIVPLFADGAGHAGSSDFTAVSTSLYRNGVKVGTNDDPLFGGKEFTVPSGEAKYKLTTSVKRSVKVAAASTRIDASWEFKSKKPTGADAATLPKNPAKGKAISFHAKIADKKGNKSTISIYNAYYGK